MEGKNYFSFNLLENLRSEESIFMDTRKFRERIFYVLVNELIKPIMQENKDMLEYSYEILEHIPKKFPSPQYPWKMILKYTNISHSAQAIHSIPPLPSTCSDYSQKISFFRFILGNDWNEFLYQKYCREGDTINSNNNNNNNNTEKSKEIFFILWVLHFLKKEKRILKEWELDAFLITYLLKKRGTKTKFGSLGFRLVSGISAAQKFVGTLRFFLELNQTSGLPFHFGDERWVPSGPLFVSIYFGLWDSNENRKIKVGPDSFDMNSEDWSRFLEMKGDLKMNV
jgi:hypothetical protein